ncbi:MAG TPA: peptidylprolyl isomerase [Gemmatimonadales bacterium]|nr:peptidylprolyl isomerase [Gemmatimonadales bacterium]
MTTRSVSAALAMVSAAALLTACSGKEKDNEEQSAAPAAAPVSPLTDPNAPELNATAPDVYRVKFETSKGDFEIEVTRTWAPRGADRFYNLVKNGWYDDNRFFRVVPNFMVQFGINGDPAISKWWRNARIADDPVTQSNKRGMITFAMSGVDSRTTQVFINFKDNAFLDPQRFAPFGRVVNGMDVVDRLNGEYAEAPSSGQGQMMIQTQGNAFLQANFPNLDYIKKASILP